MNSLGRIFRVSIWGESHGPAVGVVLDGCPPGIPLGPADFCRDLERRRSGARGTTRRRESDAPIIRSGVHEGKTTGAPINIEFGNLDVDSSGYLKIRNIPRPGHADWTALFKSRGFADLRGGGHFSGRLTAGLVAAGVVAKRVIRPVDIRSRVLAVGGVKNFGTILRRTERSGDSVGGLVECRAKGVPPGLGEPFFDSAESLLAHAVFSIPAVKGIEFGDGFRAARMKGSRFNDQILSRAGKTRTNHAGGINGGITNGNELVFRVAIRPTASISLPQRTLDLARNRTVVLSLEGRHDVCIALRVPVVLEAVTAIVLADLLLTGGQPVGDSRRATNPPWNPLRTAPPGPPRDICAVRQLSRKKEEA
jgi:chorismate synthase